MFWWLILKVITSKELILDGAGEKWTGQCIKGACYTTAVVLIANCSWSKPVVPKDLLRKREPRKYLLGKGDCSNMIPSIVLLLGQEGVSSYLKLEYGGLESPLPGSPNLFKSEKQEKMGTSIFVMETRHSPFFHRGLGNPGGTSQCSNDGWR